MNAAAYLYVFLRIQNANNRIDMRLDVNCAVITEVYFFVLILMLHAVSSKIIKYFIIRRT